MFVVIDASAVHPTSGGAGTYLRALVAHLPGVGVAPIVIARRSDLTPWTGAERVLRVAPDSRVRRLIWEQTKLASIVDSSRNKQPIVLHSPHYTKPRRLPQGVASVVTIHDLTFFSRPLDHDASKRLIFRRAIRIASDQADALICVSTATENALRRFVAVRAGVVVAQHGVDLDRFVPTWRLTESQRANDVQLLDRVGVEKPFVLHLGTIEPRKRVELLIEAVSRLGDDNLQLVLAGQIWPSFAKSFPVAKPFERRLGYVPDDVSEALLRAADAVVYPSAEEGFGLPVIEALACAAPVITTDGSAMHEAAGPVACYLPVNGDVVSELVKCIRTVRGMPQQEVNEPMYDPIARRQRAEKFTWIASAENHRRAYEMALEKLARRSLG